MYVNIGGDFHRLGDGTLEADLILDVYTPNSLIWITPINGKLKIIAHPSNNIAALELVELHNSIYNSPLAKVLREEE